MPVKELYFPPIIIRVKDNRKFGRRPTVGQHIITNSSKYRIEPPKTKDEAQIQFDEGFGYFFTYITFFYTFFKNYVSKQNVSVFHKQNSFLIPKLDF